MNTGAFSTALRGAAELAVSASLLFMGLGVLLNSELYFFFLFSQLLLLDLEKKKKLRKFRSC